MNTTMRSIYILWVPLHLAPSPSTSTFSSFNDMSSTGIYFSTLSDDERIRIVPFFTEKTRPSLFQISDGPFNRVLPVVVENLCLDYGGDISFNFRTATLNIGLLSSIETAKSMLDLWESFQTCSFGECGQTRKIRYGARICFSYRWFLKAGNCGVISRCLRR